MTDDECMKEVFRQIERDRVHRERLERIPDPLMECRHWWRRRHRFTRWCNAEQVTHEGKHCDPCCWMVP